MRMIQRSKALRLLSAAFALSTLALGLSACGNDSGGKDASAADSKACKNYPDGDVKYIVPFSAGGGSGAWAEAMKPVIAKKLGVNVQVEYLPGGGGIRGANQIGGSAPDGKTFGLMLPNDVALANLLGHAEYDVKDMTILARMTLDPQVFYVSSDSDVNSMADLVKKSKTEPIKHAGQEISAIEAITYDLFGVDWKFILQAGTPETNLAIRRGDADVSVGSLGSVQDFFKDGEMKVILYEGPEPDPSWPGYEYVKDAPTAEEMGHGELSTDLVQQRIMMAPPGLPQCIEEKLSKAMADTLQDPEFLDRATKAGLTVDYADGEEVTALLDKSLAVYERFDDVLKKSVK